MVSRLKLLAACLLLSSIAHGQVLLSKFGPVTGVLLGTAGNPATQAAAITDLQTILSTSPGLVLNGATGGSKGPGTINSPGLYVNGAAVGVGGGAVSSVGLGMSGMPCTVAGSPVTSAGTLSCTANTESANTVWAGPTTGAAASPAFRALVAADIPSLAANPSGLIGLTAANGVATTYERSDATHALDQSIAPTWTGAHTFNQTVTGSATAYEGFLAGPSVAGAGGIRFHATESITAHAHYAFVDDSTMTFAGGGTIGHASFDASGTITGSTVNFDHHHDYQAAPHFSFTSGTATEVTSFQTQPFISSGAITSMYLFGGYNPVKTGGTIGTLYGLYLSSLTDGATNWAVYADGTTPSFFGGNVTFGRGFADTGQATFLQNSNAPAVLMNGTGGGANGEGWRVDMSGTNGSFGEFFNSGTFNGYIGAAKAEFTGGNLADFAIGAASGHQLIFGINTTIKATMASDGGVFMAGATGGSQGSGTINATGVYVNGVNVSVTATQTLVKASTTARTSTTTLANDPDLVSGTLATGQYRVDGMIQFTGTTTSAQGVQFELVSSGNSWQNIAATSQVMNNGIPATGSTTMAIGQVFTFTSVSAASTAPDWMLFTGTLNVASSGTLAFQWAQNSSNANATNVLAGSRISITKIP